MTSTRVMLFIAATVIAVALGLVVNSLFLDRERPTSTAGLPSIGGPFELVDHKGRTVRDSDYRGKYMLVMFGYTYCPDICPTELQVMSEAMDQLGDTAAKVQPLMITVDPERDTAAVLADYVSNFHPSIVGLSGSLEQVKAVARGYRVYFSKNPADDDGDYLVDHSAFIYLMGPDGRFLYHFPPTTAPDALAGKVRAVIAETS